jgi:hypothetical protein
MKQDKKERGLYGWPVSSLADLVLETEAKLEAMNTTPIMLALASSLSDWQDSGSMTGEIEIFVPVDIARAIRVWVAAQEEQE